MSETPRSLTPAGTSAAPARRVSWPLAAVLIAMLLIVGIPVGYLLVSWGNAVVTAPRRAMDAISYAAAEAARPKIDVHKVVVNSVSDLKKENKLVVYKAQLSADITQTDNYSRFGIYWGANTARVMVRDAQVQYVIDMSNLQTSDFIYNDQAKVVSVFIPRPKLDTEMVSIDPAKIQTLDLRGGWARFDKQETRDRAIAELRPSILSQATAPFIRELAAANGIDSTTKLLQPLAESLAKDGITVNVTYHD